ncbi:MAG: DbpA RNA binding domain-containing protein, partial [Woeseia sp.]
AYIHRIGRTGRAGRQGEAILFVAPREQRMLYVIEKATRQKIEKLVLPTTETVNNKRIADFKQKITDTLASGDLAFMQGLIEQYRQEHDVPALEIAAALAKMSIGDKPMLLSPDQDRPARRSEEGRPRHKEGKERGKPSHRKDRRDSAPRELAADKERYRLEVGHKHGVKPGNIVGAIANEAGLDGEHIGSIDIHDEYSLVDLPRGMPRDVFMDLKKTRVCGQAIKITAVGKTMEPQKKRKPKAAHGKKPEGKPKGGKPKGSKPAGKPKGPRKARIKPATRS